MNLNDNSQRTKSLIKIAFVGHTNVGKTTTIRTLVKRPIGKVDDRANVTKRVTKENYTYEGLQALFIDTPGFQEANNYLFLREANMSIPVEHKTRLQYDVAAYEAIEESDIVVFVVSLDAVPEGYYEQEIKLVVSSGKRIIALLNKGISKASASDPDMVANRVEQWREILIKYGIVDIFEFDSHWYISSTVSDIYKSVERLLPPHRREVFKRGLNDFEAYHQDIAYRACCLIVDCLSMCRKTSLVKCKPDDDSEEKKSELATKLYEEVCQSFSVFLEEISKLYYELRVNASNPDVENAADSQLSMKSILNPKEILLNTGAYAGGAAVYAAAIGAVVGAVASTALTGGIGAVGGAWLGTQVGSAVGSFLGGAAALVDTTRTKVLSISLPNDALAHIENLCMTIVWALSQHGYGLGPEVSRETLERRRELVQEYAGVIDWTTVENDVAVQYCEQTLQKLSDISPYSLSHGHGKY